MVQWLIDSPCNERDGDSVLDQVTKIPHGPEHLSPHATTTEQVGSGTAPQLSSVQFSRSVVSDNSLQPHESQHATPPCPSQTLGVYSNSCPLSR